jgi:hypothetical protein
MMAQIAASSLRAGITTVSRGFGFRGVTEETVEDCGMSCGIVAVVGGAFKR